MNIPDLDPEQVAALSAAAELEIQLRVLRMPCVLLIGCPGKQQFVRVAGGMQDPDTCAGFRIQVNALLDNFHKAPPDRMTPAALMDLSAFHARMAQKCVDAANAKCEPADSGIRKQGLSHIVWAEQIAAHAQNLQA